MANDDVTAPLREALAQRTGTRARDWFCCFKARYGMRETFRAVRATNGDGCVTTTLFTGCTAVDSFLSAGLSARYAPIDEATLSVDARAADVGGDVRAVLLQNTYGMVCAGATRMLRDKAHAAGAILVEDSAHCLARMARDDQGEPLADVSVHSFGIEKTFSDVYFGGAIWVNPNMGDSAAHDAIVSNLSAMEPLPARTGRACERYRTHARVISHLPGALSRAARSLLVATGSYEPPVADVERRGQLPYPSYLPSEWIVGRIMPRLATLGDDEARRVEATRAYAQGLAGVEGARVPAAALGACANQPLIRFPMLLGSEAQARALASCLLSAGHYAVRWYFCPFFPGATDTQAYGMSPDDPRLAAYAKGYGGAIGLPTENGGAAAREVMDIVRDFLATSDASE